MSSEQQTSESRPCLVCTAFCGDRIFLHPILGIRCCGVCFCLLQSLSFKVGEDGLHELCTWCGLGGDLLCCSDCPRGYCNFCVERRVNCALDFFSHDIQKLLIYKRTRHFGKVEVERIQALSTWSCFACSQTLAPLRAEALSWVESHG